jgi:DNA (cytosine-5)-methyltransferase 1
MTHGSLFSGIGGFEYAAQAMGWENVFHCEINPFGQQVLKYHYPKSISYDDITKTDFSIHAGQIDIITGGFPCQPYSQAGKRLGKEDDRHLWPEMLRVIRQVQPRWVVGENVFGLINWNDGLVFDEVQADLETQGYEVQPYVLPAVAVNAPHRRDRVWFVAYAHDYGRKRWNGKINGEGSGKSDSEGFGQRLRDESIKHGSLGITSNSENKRLRNGAGIEREQPINRQQWGTVRRGTSSTCESSITPNSNRNGLNERNSNDEVKSGQRGEYAQCDVDQVAMHTYTTRLEGFENKTKTKRKGSGKIKLATRPIRTGFENFPTQSPICGGNDGLPTELHGITFPKWRAESIKAYGNAIVPQVAIQIFKAIEQYDQLQTTKQA